MVLGLLDAPVGVAATAALGRRGTARRPGSGERPVWDDKARELWWRSRLVKRFRNDAANQRLIVQAFVESLQQNKKKLGDAAEPRFSNEGDE